jgi:hypothetical protein
MEKKGKKLSNGMKILGVSLLLLVIPGSTLLLPYLLKPSKKSNDEDKTNEVLGI